MFPSYEVGTEETENIRGQRLELLAIKYIKSGKFLFGLSNYYGKSSIFYGL